MKITKVSILYVHNIKTDSSQLGQRPILLRIDTDEGIYGIGEVGMAYGTGGDAAVGMVKDYAEMIIGMDPMNTEAIWEKFMKTTFWGQGGGTVIYGGMSGIDIALWDIKGKALGVPVYQLLGGKCRDRMRTYASQIQLAWGPVRNICRTPEEFAEQAMVAVSQGYDAVKADVLQFDENGVSGGYWLEGPLKNEAVRVGEARVKAIRDAVGPDVDIIVENHAHTDTVAGVQFAKAIEKYNIMFYEELNSPLNPKLTLFAKNHINIPLAAGERIYTRWGYRPFLEDHSLDVIQPDMGTCGGITECKKICDMAHVYDVTVQVHVAGTAVACAAGLNMEAAIPNFCIHEHHQKALMPQYIELCTEDYQPVNGYMPLPRGNGIGQDLTDLAYKHSDIITIEK